MTNEARLVLADYQLSEGGVVMTGPFMTQREVDYQFGILEREIAKAKAKAKRLVRL